ncbi:MAG: hypothetical protein JNK12_01540 [Acidimicrobiales bacterium]|nr:hypothetical protein [Acidimicrobiales bacterium]
MTGWHELGTPPQRPRPRWGAVARRAAPFLAAGLLWALGLSVAALAVAVVGAVLVIAGALRPSVAARVEQALAAFGTFVGHALTLVLLGLVEVVVFVPLYCLAKVFRRDPLAERGGMGAPGRWSVRDQARPPTPDRPFAPEARPAGRVFRVAYATVRVIGWVVIALALNYAAGWLWDEWFGTHDQPVAAPVSAQTAAELADAPAMVGQPWAEDYWEEFRALDYEFHPFILSRVADVDGTAIQVDGAVRRSYEPAALGPGTPEVWFLGGAALWGQGQRDEHTIPSEVARLAEAEGRSIRAVNLGQPGYTSWQSALLLEQELAVRPPPDLVVFYDGADDVAAQMETPSADPVHYNVDGVTAALVGRDSARDQAQDWWDDYRETSVVNRLLEQAEGILGVQPAGAAGPSTADRVADLHARSTDLAAFVAGEHDVPILFTWQAASGVAGDGGAYRRVTQRDDTTGPVVHDLSRVLDDAAAPVYLDGVLTNEAGAALVAEELWGVVQPALG